MPRLVSGSARTSKVRPSLVDRSLLHIARALIYSQSSSGNATDNAEIVKKAKDSLAKILETTHHEKNTQKGTDMLKALSLYDSIPNDSNSNDPNSKNRVLLYASQLERPYYEYHRFGNDCAES